MLNYLVNELDLDINAMDDIVRVAPDGRGQLGTPLDYATRHRNVAEVRWLLEYGPNPDLTGPFERTARDRAKKELGPNHEIVTMLLLGTRWLDNLS